MNLSVILVSPQGPANVGSIARLMANFGFSDLRLVKPRCNHLGDEARMMSLKALPILQKARLFDTLQEAQADLEFTYAFSMIQSEDRRPVYKLQDCISQIQKEVGTQSKMGFIFGREDHGLEREEIRLSNAQVIIPSDEGYPSLNLSSSVAIALYGVYSQLSDNLNLQPSYAPPRKIDEDVFFEGFEKFVKFIGFLNPKTNAHIMNDFRDMYHRAKLSERELRILFGVVADLEYRFGTKFFKN